MKVKIGNTIHNSQDEPIMIIIDENDKKNISMMGDQTKYASFPYGMTPNKMRTFMGLDPITPMKKSKNCKGCIYDNKDFGALHCCERNKEGYLMGYISKEGVK